ncbi:MAG: ketosteroid isomerase-like protein [Flavobacteriales bacterium]|jgi:ketosteroid isomerase-like protein
MKQLFLFIAILVAHCVSAQSTDELAIKEIMSNQQAAWNTGDIDAFMEGYWKSDSLMFIGSKGPTYGWDKTLANYKTGYPDIQAMGQLEFTNLTFSSLEANHYLVVGKWHLEREGLDNLEGHYSLVWKRINNIWVIIADHSS